MFRAQAKVFMVALRHADDDRSEVDFTNGTIDTSFSQYEELTLTLREHLSQA